MLQTSFSLITSFPKEYKRPKPTSIAGGNAALFVPTLLVVSQLKVNKCILVNTRCSLNYFVRKYFY